jgi:hypothetical protein
LFGLSIGAEVNVGLVEIIAKGKTQQEEGSILHIIEI